MGLRCRCLALLVLSVPLAGCGSYGRGRVADAPSDLLGLPPSVMTFVKWPKKEKITWTIIGGSHSTIPGTPTPRAMAELGANSWSNALEGTRLRLTRVATIPADITISLESPFFDQGYTSLHYIPKDPTQGILKAEIQVSPELFWQRIREITAHEMGHALGLRGHSPYAGDLMRSNAPKTATPTQREVNTIRKMYATQ